MKTLSLEEFLEDIQKPFKSLILVKGWCSYSPKGIADIRFSATKKGKSWKVIARLEAGLTPTGGWTLQKAKEISQDMRDLPLMCGNSMSTEKCTFEYPESSWTSTGAHNDWGGYVNWTNITSMFIRGEYTTSNEIAGLTDPPVNIILNWHLRVTHSFHELAAAREYLNMKEDQSQSDVGVSCQCGATSWSIFTNHVVCKGCSTLYETDKNIIKAIKGLRKK